jgi:hypothetical protein
VDPKTVKMSVQKALHKWAQRLGCGPADSITRQAAFACEVEQYFCSRPSVIKRSWVQDIRDAGTEAVQMSAGGGGELVDITLVPLDRDLQPRCATSTLCYCL